MTVSSNPVAEFSRDEMVVMAYQLTGLLEAGKQPPADDIAMAANFMRMELAALQAEGVVLQTTERTTLTLVSGTAAYTLPSDTVEIKLGPNDQLGTIVPSSGSETVVQAMTRAEYLDVTDKTSDTTGRPTRGYLEKLASVTLTLWPVPDSDAPTFRYARVRLIRDMDDGAMTLDLARRWMKYVTYATAVALARAKSCPLESVMDLRNESERMKEVCMADDQERPKIRFRLRHSGARW